MQCVTLHVVQKTVSAKAAQILPPFMGGGQTGIHTGDGCGHGFMHGFTCGNNRGDGSGSRDQVSPHKWVPMSVSQLSLLCQVLGEDP